MPEIKGILYPTDFSENQGEVFSYVLSLADKYRAKIEILHVVHDIADMTGFYVPHISYDVLEKEMEDAALENIRKFAEENVKGKAEYEVHIRRGTPFHEIINAVIEFGSDLIVMGTHGRAGIDHVLFGSTAEKVVRKSPIPVMTVKSSKNEFSMP